MTKMRSDADLLANPKEVHDWLYGQARRLHQYGVSNCRGTALFLAGEIDEDIYVSSKDMKKKLERMERSDGPRPGAIITFSRVLVNERDFTHAGIVTDAQNELITNRWHYQGQLFVDQPFVGMGKRHVMWYEEIRYHIPKRFERFA